MSKLQIRLLIAVIGFGMILLVAILINHRQFINEYYYGYYSLFYDESNDDLSGLSFDIFAESRNAQINTYKYDDDDFYFELRTDNGDVETFVNGIDKDELDELTGRDLMDTDYETIDITVRFGVFKDSFHEKGINLYLHNGYYNSLYSKTFLYEDISDSTLLTSNTLNFEYTFEDIPVDFWGQYIYIDFDTDASNWFFYENFTIAYMVVTLHID